MHLSLCNHESKLKDVCSKILRKAPTGIRDEIIKALEKEIRTLKTKHHNNRNNIKNKTTGENYKLIEEVVDEKVVTLEQKIKSHQVRKLSRDKYDLLHQFVKETEGCNSEQKERKT